jgi:hypothetical protein
LSVTDLVEPLLAIPMPYRRSLLVRPDGRKKMAKGGSLALAK